MPQVDDVVMFVHGKNDNLFHEGKNERKALVTAVKDNQVVNLSILNEEGNPTIPVSNVPHKTTKGRDLDAAYWKE